MTLVQLQTELLSYLAQLMLDQVDEQYDLITCTYEYLGEYDTIFKFSKGYDRL